MDDTPSHYYNEIGQALVSAAPADWDRLVATFCMAGKTSQSQSVAMLVDGTTVGLWGPGRRMSVAFKKLRQALYQRGKGAWYSATATVTRDA